MPYTYFADNLVRQGNLKQRYDVIIFRRRRVRRPASSTAASRARAAAYKKTAETPHLGIQDSTDDMRGGLGYDGLQELTKFVQEGGGADHGRAHLDDVPEFNLTPGDYYRTGRGPQRPWLGDEDAPWLLPQPVLDGYDQNALAVYFNQGPISRLAVVAADSAAAAGAAVARRATSAT